LQGRTGLMPMDGIDSVYQHLVERRDGGGQASRVRSFLFLQGPISDFNDRLGRALIARGHRVHRVNLHLGDQLFWRLPATHFRGRFDEWRGFIRDILDTHAVTDLIVHGDRRPYHIVAAEEARARGIAVIATDLGYVRPDWVTIEYDGLTTYSRFPRDPDAIRALAEKFPPPDLMPRFRGPSFAYIAALDVIYNFALVLGRPLYPHYQCHGIFHPFAEYLGWMRTLARQNVTRRATIAAKGQLAAAPQSYFLFPLQLATDYQIRAHSQFVDGRDAVRQVITSYAASGTTRKLAIAIHPLDNGLIDWRRLAMSIARDLGVADQVVVLDCGTPHQVLRNAAGVVTINSTSGLTALYEGLPVKVLGSAIFDIPGLTHQGDLDGFWKNPTRPDKDLLEAFARALIGSTQLKGGYYEAEAKTHTVAALIERLEQRPYPLPPLTAAELAARQTKTGSSVAIFGVGSELTVALARAYAEPGTRLCLIGPSSDVLERTADDCRHRGAIVELCTSPSLAEKVLEDFDERAPIDILLADLDYQAPRVAVARMARRGGHIAFIDRDFHSHPSLRSTPFHPSDDSEVWRQRLIDTAVAVSVIRPSDFARRLAPRLQQPDLLTENPERAAQTICSGISRGQATIEFPGMATIAMRALRAAFRVWTKSAPHGSVDTMGDAPEEIALRREPGAGN
jgi:capsular polysaccharide export protein